MASVAFTVVPITKNNFNWCHKLSKQTKNVNADAVNRAWNFETFFFIDIMIILPLIVQKIFKYYTTENVVISSLNKPYGGRPNIQ